MKYATNTCRRLRNQFRMSISTSKYRSACASDVGCSDDALSVRLADGRVISVPLVWFPRLFYGTVQERSRWELIGDGEGIHWPDLDEDISVEGLLKGYPSGESKTSLAKWFERRAMQLPAESNQDADASSSRDSG
jgi:hypothetical protein